MYRSSKRPINLLNPKPSSRDETLVEASKFKVDVVTTRKDGRKEGSSSEATAETWQPLIRTELTLHHVMTIKRQQKIVHSGGLGTHTIRHKTL